MVRDDNKNKSKTETAFYDGAGKRVCWFVYFPYTRGC